MEKDKDTEKRLALLDKIEQLHKQYQFDRYAKLENFYRDVRILIQQNEEDEKNGKTEQN